MLAVGGVWWCVLQTFHASFSYHCRLAFQSSPVRIRLFRLYSDPGPSFVLTLSSDPAVLPATIRLQAHLAVRLPAVPATLARVQLDFRNFIGSGTHR